jgi:hypothetical protein
MTGILKQSNGLTRLSKTKFLSILAVSALVFTSALLRADSDGNQSDKGLVGTWLKGDEGSPNTPLLTTFMSDGSVISTRTVVLGNGFQFVSTGHGQWARTGHHEFTSTIFFFRSGPTVEFAGLVKAVETITLNRGSDQISRFWTLYIYDENNNLVFPAVPDPVPHVCKRVIAGQ